MKPQHFFTPDSKAMWAKATSDRHARMRLFNEIMTGPNPLTPEECARMVAKRPIEYGFMIAFGPKASQVIP